MNRSRVSAVLALACSALLPAVARAQERAVAIRNARVLTMQGQPLEGATVVLRDGVIVDVGVDVEPPAGALTVDARGGTLMPGLVSAYGHAGVEDERRGPQTRSTRGRRRGMSRFSQPSSANAKNEAAAKVTDSLYARQDVFGDLLACGVTTLAIAPRGPGFPGQGAVLDPAGTTVEELAVDDQAFVAVQPAAGTANKKVLTDALEKAKKVVEERKKPKPEPEPEKKPEQAKEGEKAAEGKEAEKPEKPAEGKEGEKEKTPAEGEKENGGAARPGGRNGGREAKPDPNVEIVADALEGKRRAFVEITSASDLVQWADAVKDARFGKTVLVAPRHANNEGRLDEALDLLKKHQATILTSPSLTTDTYSSAVVNPAARLATAGFEIGFLLGDSKNETRELFFALIDQVRHGLDPETALRAVTLVPAKALGIDGRVGSIEKGKDADLLLFDGDPLDPTAKLVRIWHKGREIDEERTQ